MAFRLVRTWPLLLLSLCLACGVGPPHLVLYEHNGESVDLRDLPPGYPAFPAHDHPATIPPKVLLQLLEGVHYRRAGALPFMWRQPRRVFTDREGQLLAAQMQNAFKQALPQEVVAFTVLDEKDPHSYTAGFSFVSGNDLHLILEQVKEFTYVGEQKSYQQEVRWELLPRDGQRIFTKDPSGKGSNPHWIVLPLSKIRE